MIFHFLFKKLKKSYIVLLLKGKLYEKYFDIKVFGLGCHIFVQNSMAIELLIDKLSFATFKSGTIIIMS